MEKKHEEIVPVGIFWDIENCPVPKHKAVGDVIDKIRDEFTNKRPNHIEFEFLIGCAVTNKHLADRSQLVVNLPPDIARDIDRKDGVFLTQVMQKPDGVDNKLIEGILKFVDTIKLVTSIKPVVVLISGDQGFGKILFAIKRRQCDPILLYSDQCRETLKSICKEAHSFQTFCAGVPMATTKADPTREDGQNKAGAATKTATETKPKTGAKLQAVTVAEKVELEIEPKLQPPACPPVTLFLNVAGFPGKIGSEALQKKLQGFMDGYEGQVVQVKNGQACINFKSIEQSSKARDFILTTDHFGVPLKATFTRKPVKPDNDQP